MESNIPDNTVVIPATSRKIRQALADFIQAKADEKSAKERKAQAETTLREALGDKKIAFVGKTKAFSLVASKTTSFDRETLERDFPVAYATTLRVTEYDYIRTA
jgi:hypothetical protein